MPLYVDDWLSSLTIASFTVEQEGAYGRLLKWQWKSPNCTLPKDETQLANYSRLGSRWRKVGRPIIAACFVEVDGRWRNQRCYQVWLEAQGKSEKARASARARWDKERQGRLPVNGPDVWPEMLRAYGRCLRCGSTSKALVKDHIIPRYQGGSDTPQNWQPLCSSCNSSKGPSTTDYRVGLPETKQDWLPKPGNGGGS